MEKKEYILRIAKDVLSRDTVMTVPQLAENLNNNGFTTSYGTEYEGERGTYTLIHATYNFFVDNDRQDDADIIAEAFVKPDGGYAYEK